MSVKGLHEACFDKLFKGRPKIEFEHLSAQFVDQFSQEDYIESVLFKLREVEGVKYICSSSPDFLVSLFAKKFKVDEWLASSYDLDQKGCFSKIGFIVDGERKAAFLKEKRILGETTVAYSDSLDDLPFLQAADVAFFIKRRT